MAYWRRFGGGDLALLTAVLVVAAGARIWYLNVCANSARSPGPIRVQETPPELEDLVGNLKDYRWFGSHVPLAQGEERTAYPSPGYPWFLLGLQALPSGSTRWVQCALGTLTAVLYFVFALQAFGNRLVAGLTGLFCALYPFWIINTAQISDGVVTTFLLAACVTFGSRGALTGGVIASVLYGLALGGLALVRAALLPFALVALLWFFFRCRTLRRGWLCALVAFLAFANGLVPWSIRNYKMFGEVVPLSDSAFLHLWVGNNPESTGGPQSDETILKTLAATRGEDVAQTAQHYAQLAENKRYQQLGRYVFDQVRADPAGTVKRRLWAGLDFVFGATWFKQGILWQDNGPESGTFPAWLAGSYPAMLYGSLLALLVLGALGWRWSYAWRLESSPASLAVIWLPLPYVLSHAGNLNGPRLPLDGIFLCYSAFALACLVTAGRGVLFTGPAYPTERV
jgi:4-amino-4-deoxy-L-arabinose transferase-like glycosyltransferase